MAFKLNNPPYKIDNTPIYHVNMEDDVLGKANNNGTIIINKDVDPSRLQDVINHEMVHIDQMKRGDLNYDDKNVYWKGKIYPRNKMNEGAKNLPWEDEAYKNA
ncbi:hypothetical protein [Marinobacter sp.]|uniref:hypothetical protein n=1 Tax=Marinobacter sp. TaxID=50741 RepID=UPI00257F55FE|nr:hypothetical protein [Marinobacter sp.]|tara:strand:+ start:3501 stop:3809 length:309 start_codon:yes stop_codon:yes gene_type:complete